MKDLNQSLSHCHLVEKMQRQVVNEDLARERNRCSFNVEQLTNIIHGGPQKVKRKRFLENVIQQDPVLNSLKHLDVTSERGDQYEESLRRSVYLFKKAHDMGIKSDERIYMAEMVLPHLPGPFNLHFSMFRETLLQHCTEEQKRKWMPKVENLQIIGTYAQTEIGHGTFIRGLEATATYDEETKEFILNSPTVSSAKCWPGSLGKTANVCIFYAQLFIKGKCHGLHMFFVPLRNLEDHTPFPGVEIGDIGPKLGYTNMTNGFLRLTNYRIPRDNMLMRYAKVTEDGTYIAPPNKRLAYGTMVYIRALLTKKYGLVLAESCTIAIRYSAVRRQTESKPGGEELQILDYQTQQMKLFIQLANAYAVYISGVQVMNIYTSIMTRIEQGDLSELPNLHALTAALKAYCTHTSLVGTEECRLACGGHGYSQASGFPKIFAHSAPAPIVEGESTILYLQTARFLIKSLKRVQNGERLTGLVEYLSIDPTQKSAIDERLNLKDLVTAFQHRASRLIKYASLSVDELLQSGNPMEVAWNKSGVLLTRALKAHCEAYVVKAFADFLSNPDIEENIRRVLTLLCKLYAVHGLYTNRGELLQDGFMSSEQMDIIGDKLFELLADLRPEVVGLVDAFDFPDKVLDSCLGRYDGQVYQALYEFAKNSSFNKSDVHPAITKYIKPLTMNSQHSRL